MLKHHLRHGFYGEGKPAIMPLTLTRILITSSLEATQVQDRQNHSLEEITSGAQMTSCVQ